MKNKHQSMYEEWKKSQVSLEESTAQSKINNIFVTTGSKCECFKRCSTSFQKDWEKNKNDNIKLMFIVKISYHDNTNI